MSIAYDGIDVLMGLILERPRMDAPWGPVLGVPAGRLPRSLVQTKALEADSTCQSLSQRVDLIMIETLQAMPANP